MRTALLDVLRDAGFLGGHEVTVLRAHHVDQRPAFAHNLGHACHHLGASPHQVQALAALVHGVTQAGKEVGAVDVLADRRAQPVARDVHADSVGQDQGAGRQVAAVARVTGRDVGAGGVDKADLCRAPGVDQVQHAVHGVVHLQVVHLHVQDADPEGRLGGGGCPGRPAEVPGGQQQQARIVRQSAMGQVVGVAGVFGHEVDRGGLAQPVQAGQARAQLGGWAGVFADATRPWPDPGHVTAQDVDERGPVGGPQAGQPVPAGTLAEAPAQQGEAAMAGADQAGVIALRGQGGPKQQGPGQRQQQGRTGGQHEVPYAQAARFGVVAQRLGGRPVEGQRGVGVHPVVHGACLQR